MLTPTSPVTLSDYNSAILSDNSTHARIVFPVQNVTFTDSDISAEGGITLTQIMNPDTDLVMGKAVASQIVIHFLNNGQFTGFNWTEEFRVDFGVEISGSTSWVTVGYFTGKKPERITRAEVIEFTAIDRMSKFDTLADDFLSTLTYPKTMTQIYSALCTYIGVSKVTGDENSTVMSTSYSASPFTNGITCRALLAYIAEANCCYAKITSAGKVKLVWFADQTSNYSIDGNDYFAINLDEASVPVIDSVRISDTQNENNGFIYPVGTNDVVYQIVDNPLLLAMTTSQKQTVINNITTRFTAIGAYTPISVNAIGNWMVETGDIIEVGYDNNQTVNMPVFSRTMQWNGGCSDVYELTGKTERTEMSESAKQQYDMGGKLGEKYTIQSGVDITDQGVTISGGKFVKILTGGTFQTESNNFKIDSSGNVEVVGSIKAGSTFAGTMSAGCITSGTMSADRISGGTLILGGNNNTNGIMQIKNSSNTVVGTFDKDGISYSGAFSITSGGTFDVNSTNFIIDSTNKYIQIHDGTINQHGIYFDNGYQYFFMSDHPTYWIGYNANYTGIISRYYTLERREISFVSQREYDGGTQFKELPITFYYDNSIYPAGVYVGSDANAEELGVNTTYWGMQVLPQQDPRYHDYRNTYVGTSTRAWQYGYFDNLYKNGDAVLTTSNVYNGLDKTASGYALDARQGKALNDSKVNKSGRVVIDRNESSSCADCNAVTEMGTYRVISSTANRPEDYATMLDMQSNNYVGQIAVGISSNSFYWRKNRTASWIKAAVDGQVVKKSGDTMTGALTATNFTSANYNLETIGSKVNSITRTIRTNSTNRKATFTLEDGHHALVCIASGFSTFFRSGSTLYNSGLPSGFTAALSGSTVTITRNSDTTFVVDGLVI